VAAEDDGLRELFELFADGVPPGFRYRRDFITADEEAALADDISRVEFSNFEMRGVVARRRVAFFGSSYDSGDRPSPPIPPFLIRVRERIAAWAEVEPGAFAMALLNEYPPGAPIGWHRDAPQYDIVAGISLLSSCRMTFRPYVAPEDVEKAGRRTSTNKNTLHRRSANKLTAQPRSGYEHHIPAVAALRYSITFRTLRARR